VLRVSGLGPAPRRIGPRWSEFLRAQAQSMLGTGLPSEPGRGLEDNASARSAPTPEAASCRVEADELSANGNEEPSWPLPSLPRLSAVAAVPSPCDPTAAPPRSAQPWHARDGPRTRRRPLHARALRPGCQSRRMLAPSVRVATTGRVPRGGCETVHPSRPSATGRTPLRAAVEPSFFTPIGRRPRSRAPRARRSVSPRRTSTRARSSSWTSCRRRAAARSAASSCASGRRSGAPATSRPEPASR
jgi:hypothetical protein